MASGPGQAVLGWVAGVLGTGPPEVVCGLRDGASPWLLRAGGREVVLRVGRPAIAHELATEAAALELAAEAGVSVPELLGSDDGRAAGVPVVLSARLPGSSQIPREPDPARLAELGRQAARLHAIALDPSPLLPARDRPIAPEDFAAMRRSQPPRELLAAAEEAVARCARPCERPVLLGRWHIGQVRACPMAHRPSPAGPAGLAEQGLEAGAQGGGVCVDAEQVHGR
jgi:phosphotransferase family enzyme